MAYVSRDPFATTELHRITRASKGTTLSRNWCDQTGRRLYQYQTRTDAGRCHLHDDAYHG